MIKRDAEGRPANVIRKAVAPLEGVTLRMNAGGRITITAPGITPTKLTVRWAGEGWPGDVRDLLASVPRPWPRDLVVTARDLSPGAIDALTEAGANFADEQGRAHLIIPPGLLIERQALTAPKARRQTWSRSSEAVGELLLASAAAGDDANVPVRTVEIAADTGWSPGQVSNVLRFFDQQGWTRREGSERGSTARRVLADELGLLDGWSGYVAQTPRRTFLAHALVNEPMQWIATVLAPKLEGTTWALSGLAAAEMLQRTMIGTPGVIHCYLRDDDFDAAVEHACTATGLRPVESGERVVLWAGPPWVWATRYRRSDADVPIVSVARVYADLLRIGGRGVDAAAMLRERYFERR